MIWPFQENNEKAKLMIKYVKAMKFPAMLTFNM